MVTPDVGLGTERCPPVAGVAGSGWALATKDATSCGPLESSSPTTPIVIVSATAPAPASQTVPSTFFFSTLGLQPDPLIATDRQVAASLTRRLRSHQYVASAAS